MTKQAYLDKYLISLEPNAVSLDEHFYIVIEYRLYLSIRRDIRNNIIQNVF